MKEEMAKKLARKKIIHDLFGDEFSDFDKRFAGRVMDFGDELVPDMLEFITPEIDEKVKGNVLPDGISREKLITFNARRLRDMLMNVFGNYIIVKIELLLDLCNECDTEDCILSSMYVKDAVRGKEEQSLPELLSSILRRHQHEQL